MIYVLVILVLLLVLLYAYLAWWPAGRKVTGEVGPYPVSPRIVLGSPVAYVVRFLRGKGKNDPPSGITLFGKIHVTRGAGPVLLCHEIGHWLTGEEIGHHKATWKAATSPAFRKADEQKAHTFGLTYHTDGYFKAIT